MSKRNLFALFFLLASLPMTVRAAEPPERGLSAAFNYPGIILGPDDEVDLGLTIRNLGLSDDTFLVTVVDRPEGWTTELRGYSRTVTGVFLPGRDQAGLDLLAAPPDGARPEPGVYRFRVRVASQDGAGQQETECQVTVRGRAGGGQALALVTAHPELRGPSDSRFSFSLDVRNQGGEDALVNLSVAAPDGWEAWFKPSYEDKQVASIQIPKGQSRTLSLEVTPGFAAQPGRHPLRIKAESRRGAAGTTLWVDLAGTYKIRLLPANELLSGATEPGRPLSMNFFVLNEGSAPQREVKFVTVAPDNWRVEFSPEAAANVSPHQTPTPVTMTVTPPDDALVGDYGLGLAAEGERAKSTLDLRLTVRAKAAWAWLGAGIIVAVAAGLVLAFRRLGRR